MSGGLIDYAENYFQNSLFLLQQSKYVEALVELEKAERVAKLLLEDPENDFFQINLQINFRNICTLGKLTYEIGRFPQAHVFNELSFLISQKLLKTEPNNVTYQSNVGEILNNFGVLLKNMGHIEEAKQKYEKALNIRQKLLKTDPKNTMYQSKVGETLNNLGNLLLTMGRIEEAKQKYEKALGIRQKLLKMDSENIAYKSDLGDTLNNLGLLLWNMGRIEEAKQRYEKALDICEKLLKTDSKSVVYQSDIAMTLNNLGILLNDMGHIEEAKQRYEKALDIYEKLLNTDHENVAYQLYLGTTLNNLGILLNETGHIEEAKQRYEKALNIRQKLLKTDPKSAVYQSDVAMTLNNLGNLLLTMECFGEAKQRYEKALKIRQKLLKTDPENAVYKSYVGETLNNLGNLLLTVGHVEEARESYEKALNIRQKLLKKDPDNIAYQSTMGETLNELGVLLTNVGHIEEAKQRYKQALQIYTEPMQYLTISRKSKSIIRLIGLNSEQAGNESNRFNQMKYLIESFKLCKEYREFFIKYELRHERKLVTEVGLRAYIDFLMKNVRFETNSKKRAEEYEKALKAVEKLGKIEDDEIVVKLCSSAVCYLNGRSLVNKALASKKPELELLRQAVEHFRSAKETYDKANVCFCIYIGLLNILEEIEKIEDVDVSKLKKLIQKVIDTLPKDINNTIRVSFENIPQIFEEKDKMTREQLLTELDEKVAEIEYKALENLFGHVHKKIKDYFEEPFSPNVFYENWKLRVKFDDPEKVKGKLTIKADCRIIFNRRLSKGEIEQNLIEIDYLKIGYFPESPEELSFTTPGQKKLVNRLIDYFESIEGENKTRILQYDCCNNICIDSDLQIAAVQLKYRIHSENSIVKLTTSETYYKKIMAILDTVKDKVDIVVFPEFSIPFEYLKEIKQYVENTGTIIIAGSHYISEGQLEKYGDLFSREFADEDLRKNISPIIVPSSKIVHTEKLFGAREERELFFNEGMKAGKINHFFKLQDSLRLGIMICYEYLNTNLRNRLISVCDVIVVPQTNPKPERFYQTAKNDINNPLCSGNKAHIMANGIFSIEDKKEVLGGSTGIVSTLDRYSYKKQDEGIIKPINGVLEQFILLASINNDFNPSKDTQVGQVPIKTSLIHIFEENEVANFSRLDGKKFLELLETIEKCEERNELKGILTNRENNEIIKTFSPLMHKHVRNLKELTLEEMKKKCRYIMVPAE